MNCNTCRYWVDIQLYIGNCFKRGIKTACSTSCTKWRRKKGGKDV